VNAPLSTEQRPVLVACPKCRRMVPECASPGACYYPPGSWVAGAESVSSNLVAAARELLRLKDLRSAADSIETSGSWNAVHQREAMLAEYRAKKVDAWDALRSALQVETTCVEHCSCPCHRNDHRCEECCDGPAVKAHPNPYSRTTDIAMAAFIERWEKVPGSASDQQWVNGYARALQAVRTNTVPSPPKTPSEGPL
jgi:hypothetical protein